MTDGDQERWTDAELADQVEAGAVELEAEIRDRYHADKEGGVHPAQRQKYENAMELVFGLRAAARRLRGGEGERGQEGYGGDENRNREPDIDTLHDEAKRDVSQLMRVVEDLETVRVTCHNGHTSTLRELRDEEDCYAPCCPRSGCDECSFTFEPSDALSPTDGEEGRGLTEEEAEIRERTVKRHYDLDAAPAHPEEAGGEGEPPSRERVWREVVADLTCNCGPSYATGISEHADYCDYRDVLERVNFGSGVRGDRLRGAPEGAGEPDAWIVRAWEPEWGWQEQLCATEDDANGWVKWYSEHEICDAFPPEKVHKVPLYARRLRTGREGLPEDVLTWAWSEAMRAFYASHTTMSGPAGRSHHYDEDALRRWRAISETLGGWHERDFWRRIDRAKGLEREDVSGTGREGRDDG